MRLSHRGEMDVQRQASHLQWTEDKADMQTDSFLQFVVSVFISTQG